VLKFSAAISVPLALRKTVTTYNVPAISISAAISGGKPLLSATLESSFAKFADFKKLLPEQTVPK